MNGNAEERRAAMKSVEPSPSRNATTEKFLWLENEKCGKRATTMANEGEGFYVCLVILWHSHCCYFLHSLCLHSLSFLLSRTKSKDSLEWTRIADFQLFTVESARNEQLFLLACFSSHECRAHIINLVFVSNSRPREKSLPLSWTRATMSNHRCEICQWQQLVH